MKFRMQIAFVSCLLLTACYSHTQQNEPISSYHNHVRKHFSQPRHQEFIAHPKPESFSICLEHSCKKYAYIKLNSNQWGKVRSLFNPTAGTAEEERDQIKKAIALLERLSGEQAGTSRDLGENFAGLGLPGQMDCIDESTNTTVYLRMLQNDGLLRWHQQASRISRGFFSGILSMPHSTAVIKETNSPATYAVDSWFLANGEEPFIVPIESWKAGWEPNK